MKNKIKLILSFVLALNTFVCASNLVDTENSTVVAKPAVVPKESNISTIHVRLKDGDGNGVRHATLLIRQKDQSDLVKISKVTEIGFLGRYEFNVEYMNNSISDVTKSLVILANNIKISELDIVFSSEEDASYE